MKKRVGILTDFASHDPAYSLCGVVANKVKMLHLAGYEAVVFVRDGFQDHEAYAGAEIIPLNHGETGSNHVKITSKTEGDIAALEQQMLKAFAEHKLTAVLTEDLIYQPNLWKAHVAARRVAKQLPGIKWFHWVHSATDMGTANKTGKYRHELNGRFPNSKLVAHHAEEANRKGSLYGYEKDEIVVIPHGHDFTEYYHEFTQELIAREQLDNADVIAVYPCRLDRGKQPHILIEVFTALVQRGYDARIVFVDFHSTGGDKKKYRQEMRSMAVQAGVKVTFTSSFPGYEYHVPHKVVRDLFDYGDMLIHPSRSESDPMILPEAAWSGCGLVLNFDLPVFRQHEQNALLYKFSSNIDVMTGLAGTTDTAYSNRQDYMDMVAGGIAYQMQNNPILHMHAKMRKTRSLTHVSRLLWQLIEGG